MGKLIVLLVMIAAGVAGYFVGARSGREAKEALERAEQAGQQALAAHDKTVKSLNERITSITAEFETGRKQLDEAHARQKTEWSVLMAGRDQRITDLAKAGSGTRSEIERLRGTLAGAQSSGEREQLAGRIRQLEQELVRQQERLAGFQCSKVAVPTEMLTVLRGSPL